MNALSVGPLGVQLAGLGGQESEQKSGAGGGWTGSTQVFPGGPEALGWRVVPFYQKHHDVFVFEANEEMIVQPLPHSSETRSPSVEQRRPWPWVTGEGTGPVDTRGGQPRSETRDVERSR